MSVQIHAAILGAVFGLAVAVVATLIQWLRNKRRTALAEHEEH